MPTLETLSDADLRGPLDTKSLQKAQSYIQRVKNPIRRGQTLTAQVRGAGHNDYNVEIDVKPSGIAAFCTCPYNWGGYCKHIGAVLLKWIHAPGTFTTLGDSNALANSSPLEVTPVEPPPTRRPDELPFWITTTIADRQHADIQQLSQWLEAIKLQELRQMARQRGWKVKGNRKAEIIQQIVEHLTDPGQALQAVLSLDEEHRQVLRAMVLLGDYASVQEEDIQRVARGWGELQAYQQIKTYTRQLCQLGLAVPGEAVDVYFPHSDFVPFVIARQLPPVLKGTIPAITDVARADALETQPVSQLHLGDPYQLVRTAGQITLLLEQLPSPLRHPMPRPRLERFHPGLEGWDYDPDELLRAMEGRELLPYADLTLTIPPPDDALPDETVERLAPVAGDRMRLEFIFSLLVAAGIFQPGSPVTVWPEVKEHFMSQDELAQRAILARVFFYMPNWSALWRILRAHPDERSNQLILRRTFSHRYFTPQQLRAELVAFRHLVLRVLASLPDGQWVDVEDLFRLMRVAWPRFDQTVWQTYRRPNFTGSWFLTEAGNIKPLNPDDARHWQLAQGRFCQTLLTGPLHWLGLADLSFENGNLDAFRLHGLADLYWDRVKSPPAPRHAIAGTQTTAPEQVVQTDHHAITVHPSSVSPQVHSLLDRIARLETATAERFVYQLDPQAAHEAFEEGFTLSEILDDWTELLPVPMPEDIQVQLADWWRAYGRVRIYQDLTVIEFQDDFTLAEIKAVTSLENHLIAEISPRLVIIPQNAVETLVGQLDRAGYTPKQTDEV
jgi:hypothetical protein